MTIAEIFATYGEPYFRSGEARVIARLLDSGPQVLATGGGAFMNAETRAGIRAKGVSVWLKADFEVLMRRVKRRATADRPMLQGDPAQRIRAPDGRALSGLCRGRRHRACRATCRTRSSSNEIVARAGRACSACSRAAPSRGHAIMTAPLRAGEPITVRGGARRARL